MSQTIEAALLNGGESRRMGRDKASLSVRGEPLGLRIVRLLGEAGVPTTTLGKAPIPGAAFLPDDESVRSPIDALRRFRPTADLVFVLSVDLPCFDPRLVATLAERIGESEAAAPYVDGFRQPLVALYRREAFEKILDSNCPMNWLRRLDVRLLDEEALLQAGVHPDATRGANTPEEWARLTRD